MHFKLQADTIDCFNVKIKFSDGYFCGLFFFFLPFLNGRVINYTL